MSPKSTQNGTRIGRKSALALAKAHVPAVNAGKLEFGLVNELESLYAVTGTGIYPGRKHPNLRVVSATIPFRVAIFVKKDSPIKSVKDIKGKRVPSGWSSQRIIQPLMDAIGMYLPSPVEAAPMFAKSIGHEEDEVELYPDPDKPMVCMAFKLSDEDYGQLTYIRIYQGKLVEFSYHPYTASWIE